MNLIEADRVSLRSPHRNLHSCLEARCLKVFVALGASCIYSAPWAAAMVHLANGKEYANGASNGEQQGRPRLSAVTSACVHVLSFTSFTCLVA